MNVSCPQCATVYRVDPAKVPQGGVRARCSTCSGVIPVGIAAQAPAARRTPVDPVGEAFGARPVSPPPFVAGRQPAATPVRPTPARPTPARPTPARPTPARATPARPTPARATPARPTPPPAAPRAQAPAASSPGLGASLPPLRP